MKDPGRSLLELLDEKAVQRGRNGLLGIQHRVVEEIAAGDRSKNTKTYVQRPFRMHEKSP